MVACVPKIQYLLQTPTHIRPSDSPHVFFDVSISNRPAGRIVFRLFDNLCPKTARNFRELATGEHGYGYRFSSIHRVMNGYWIQGGDITAAGDPDGSGGRSIYGENFAGTLSIAIDRLYTDMALTNNVLITADESFSMKHDRPGILSMANRGPHSNSSQFFITTAPTPWCDRRNVAF
ncbi:hypothetical protein EIP91_007640, partial [Steccherinum ochraceum]